MKYDEISSWHQNCKIPTINCREILFLIDPYFFWYRYIDLFLKSTSNKYYTRPYT